MLADGPFSYRTWDTVGQGSGDGRYIEQLEKRLEEKDDVIGILRHELGERNDELATEGKTNILIRGLQNLVLQLQSGRAPRSDVLDDDPMITNAADPPGEPDIRQPK